MIEINSSTQKTYKIIIDIINKNREIPTEIVFRQGKNYSTLLFYDIASLRIKCGGKESYISISPRFKDSLINYPFLKIKTVKSDDWARIIIESISDLEKLNLLFSEIYDAAYWLAPYESIACCSRYEECSDNKKCIQPIKELARGCEYNKNLVKDRIFYGKNKTNN